MKARNHPSPTIRPATADDYEQMVAVWSACGMRISLAGRESKEAFQRQLQQFPDSYLVAIHGSQVVGVVLGSHDHRKGWINRLAVLPAYRRRGFASALVLACEAAIRSLGIKIVAALVEPGNTSSAALFEKLGYLEDVPVRYFRKLDRADV